jgi:DNA-binding NarL/FixJ family response regulator
MTISTDRPLERVKFRDALIPLDHPIAVVTVVLADQCVLMHMALRALFAANCQYSVVAAAETASAAEQLVSRVRPAMLICDVDLVGEAGLDLSWWTARVSAATRVVFLTSRDEPRLAESAITAGAAGYLLKNTAPELIAASLDRVAAGEVVIDTRLGTSRAASLPVAALLGGAFSRREGEVLTQLARGLDNKSIAGQLCISEETVKSHMKAIFRKLGARDRAHAVALALGAAQPALLPARPLVTAATLARTLSRR